MRTSVGCRILIILMLAGVAVACGNAGDDPGGREGSALSTAEAYYTAAAAGDADAVRAAFADDPTIGGGTLDEHVRLLVWEASQGTRYESRSCRGEPGADNVVVTCDYDNVQPLQALVGAPPTPVTESLTITDAGIEAIDATFHSPRFPANRAFDSWMASNHQPDAVSTRCCGGDGTVDEARQNGLLRLQYAELWAEHLQQSGCDYTDINC